MKGIPEFIIRSIDELELEILIDLKTKSEDDEELDVINELICIKSENISIKFDE